VIRRILKLPRRERGLFLICLVFFLGFLFVTVFRPSFNSIDTSVNRWIPSIQSNPLTFFAKGIAVIFDTTSLDILSIVISGVLFLKHHKPHGLLLLAAMGGDGLIVSILKTLTHVTRPTNGIFSDIGFSYPSGHSAGCIVFGGILAYFAWQNWQSTRSRALIGVGMVGVVGVVGLDRVYLNVHWFSDVLGGWLFGAFWLSSAVFVFRLLQESGVFESERFSLIANWLYFVAVVVSIFVVVLTMFGSRFGLWY
jgi:membrane-associated phospholipid phosphatase